MKRLLSMFAVTALLALPVMAAAEPQAPMPPESKWTATPPASKSVQSDQKRVESPSQATDAVSPRHMTPETVELMKSAAQYNAEKPVE